MLVDSGLHQFIKMSDILEIKFQQTASTNLLIFDWQYLVTRKELAVHNLVF